MGDFGNNFGDSLNWFKNITFLVSEDAEALRKQLASANFEYKIMAMYAMGSRHYCWIIPSRPIKKTETKKGK